MMESWVSLLQRREQFLLPVAPHKPLATIHGCGMPFLIYIRHLMCFNVM